MCKGKNRKNEQPVTDNERAEILRDIFNNQLGQHRDYSIVINSYQEERPSLLVDSFKNNPNTRVAIVNKMLKEGFDFPEITIAAIYDEINMDLNHVEQYKGKREYVQFIGRAVRKIPGDDGGNQTAYIIAPEKFNLKELHDDYMESERDVIQID